MTLKLKDLTKKDIAHIKKTYNNKNISYDERLNILKSYLDKSERTVRRWLVDLGLKDKKDKVISEHLDLAKVKVLDKAKKRFIITSAQNATPVCEKFMLNMEAYAEHIDAEILVIPFRYHNPTSVFSKSDEDMEWWDESVVKYLTLNRHNLNNNISILSDVKIQPTATSPLQSLESITGAQSCVIGHPRFELRSIAVMDPYKPKYLFTTGCCTKSNFSDTKAGKRGEFHYSMGFAIVEIKDDETYFFRQVSATNTGEFIDLFHHVKDAKVTTETETEACVMGDVHVAHVNKEIIDLTLGDLFKKLHPKKLFIHDIIDSESISHHNLNDPFLLHQQEMDGSNSLQKEINDMVEWLKQVEKYNVYIVKSNHDEHIDKFLRTTDWRKMTTLKNALPYMEYATATLKGEAPNGIVPYVINKHYPKFKCLTNNDVVMVKGYLLSMHGHNGSNGSRGSLLQFSKLSNKSVTGHSHSIGRIGGAASVGTSTFLRASYTKGPSSWSNSHGIINRLGKFQHIIFFHTNNGVEYTTF